MHLERAPSRDLGNHHGRAVREDVRDMTLQTLLRQQHLLELNHRREQQRAEERQRLREESHHHQQLVRPEGSSHSPGGSSTSEGNEHSGVSLLLDGTPLGGPRLSLRWGQMLRGRVDNRG